MSKIKLTLILFILLFKHYQCQGLQNAYAKTDCLDYCEGNSQVSNDPTKSSLYEQCYYGCVSRLQRDLTVNFDCKPWAQPADQPKSNCQPFPGETFGNQNSSATQLIQAQNKTQSIRNPIQNTRQQGLNSQNLTLNANSQRQLQVGQNTAQNITRPAVQTGSQKRKLPIQNQIGQQAPQNTQNVARPPTQNSAQQNTQNGRPAALNQQGLQNAQNVGRPPVQNGALQNTQNGRPTTMNQRGQQGLQNAHNVGRPSIYNDGQQNTQSGTQNGRPTTLNQRGQQDLQYVQNVARPSVQNGGQQNTQNGRTTTLNQRGQQGLQNVQNPIQNVGRPIIQNGGQQPLYGDYPMQNEYFEYPWQSENIESPPPPSFDPTPNWGQPLYNPSFNNPPQYGAYYSQYEDDY